MAFRLETQRLILREFNPDIDAQSAFELNSDPDVLRYTGDDPFKTVEDAHKFLKKYDHYSKHGYGRWAVLLKSTSEFIGWCGLKYHDGEPIDLGYRFLKKHWNNGYATEASFACLEFAFITMQVPEIMIRIDPGNTPSIAVAIKLGAKYWKTGTCDHIDDTYYYRLSREDFLSERSEF